MTVAVSKSTACMAPSAAMRLTATTRRYRSTRTQAMRTPNAQKAKEDCGGKKDQGLKASLAAAGLAAMVASSPINGAAMASEFDVLEAPVPETSYVVDDGGILSKSGKGTLVGKLRDLEKKTGYHLDVVTMRKLQFTPDPFEFVDKILENWYPTIEQGNNRGVLLIVGSTKEGAITGGPAFMKAVDDDILDGVIGDTIPELTTQEKYNEATIKSVQRISASIEGKADPGAKKEKKVVQRKGKTAEEIKGSYKFVVGGFVAIVLFVIVAQVLL